MYSGRLLTSLSTLSTSYKEAVPNWPKGFNSFAVPYQSFTSEEAVEYKMYGGVVLDLGQVLADPEV